MSNTPKVSATLVKLPNGKNGNAPETKKEETPTSKAAPAEIPAIIPEKKEPMNKPSTIEDRFYKMDILLSHREKWEKLKDSLDKVNKFKLTTDGRSENISLKDGSGNSFSTYNPEVLAKVIEWLKADLTQKLSDVEKLIQL